MKYDRDWLHCIKMTEQLIKSTPIDDVPVQFRSTIQQQFNVQVSTFRRKLGEGGDTTEAQANIIDLAVLVNELIEEDKKQRASYAA